MQRLDKRQDAIASALAVSPSTVSRLISGNLTLFTQVLAQAGLKIVPAELKCYDPRELDALFIIARGQFDRAESVDDVLRWDD